MHAEKRAVQEQHSLHGDLLLLSCAPAAYSWFKSTMRCRGLERNADDGFCEDAKAATYM